jgi:hypothetical protein
MRTWQKRARVVVIAAASFVLLVTVLPEVASGFGLRSLENRLTSSAATSCSGSGSGSGSSAGSGSSSKCGNGTVNGTVIVVGRPTGFHPAVLGAEACPGSVSTPCSSPVSTVGSSKGAYSLSLAAGTWTLFGFYQITAGGAVFVGSPAVEMVPAGGIINNANLTVFYAKPATLAGTITVTGASSNDPIKKLTVVACPSPIAYSGGTVPNGCVSGSFKPSPAGSAMGPYSLTNLSAGSWTAYPGFCALSGCATHTGDKQTAKLKSGKTTTLNLSTAFLEFGQALLYGTVTVVGAPTGFTATLGANACQLAASCETVNANAHGQYAMILVNAVPAVGVWSVKGFYQTTSSSTPVYGFAFPVVAVTGASIQLNLPVPYRAS